MIDDREQALQASEAEIPKVVQASVQAFQIFRHVVVGLDRTAFKSHI